MHLILSYQTPARKFFVRLIIFILQEFLAAFVHDCCFHDDSMMFLDSNQHLFSVSYIILVIFS